MTYYLPFLVKMFPKYINYFQKENLLSQYSILLFSGMKSFIIEDRLFFIHLPLLSMECFLDEKDYIGSSICI